MRSSVALHPYPHAATTLLRNAIVILPGGRANTNVVVDDGKIASIDASPTTPADELIEAMVSCCSLV
jgi:dihydroorotase-like cyclic amidohydrolase